RSALALPLTDADAERSRARLLAALGRVELEQSNFDGAREAYTSSLEIARGRDERTQFHALAGLARLERAAGRHPGAVAHLEAAPRLVEGARSELETEGGQSGLFDTPADVLDELVAVPLERTSRAPPAGRDVLSAARRWRGRTLLDLEWSRSHESRIAA